MVSNTHRAVLRQAEIFHELTDDDMAALEPFLAARRLRAGDVLFQQGDAGATMVIVAEGALIARVRTAQGTDEELNRMEPGEVAGEMAFIDPAPRSATVVALTDAAVYELAHDAMAALRRDAPGAVSAMVGAVIRDVTRRLRRIDRRIEEELRTEPRGRAAPSGMTAALGSTATDDATPTERVGLRAGSARAKP